ncbi:hypothetical protein [Ferrovibrio xuzhouensis]|uniref:Uncharacterized protein n=1 Tax=Ferrovibrio xuzhouensis TaxID=1576914 RepID=A0ABV7VHI6_9PROT
MALQGLVFADIETSGLQYLSFPIEFGWAWIENDHVEARSILIKPTDEWMSWESGWSEEAEQVHGISLEQLLMTGVEPSDACEMLNRELREAEIAFDTGPSAHDARWLSILYKAASVEPSFALAKLSSDLLILGYAGMARVPDAVVLKLERLAPKVTHRAANDAAHWAWQRLALRMIGEAGIQNPDDVSGLVSSIAIKYR